LGGGITINLKGGRQSLQGEFSGSRKRLLRAIKMSRPHPNS
jgi:hypothetical protein